MIPRKDHILVFKKWLNITKEPIEELTQTAIGELKIKVIKKNKESKPRKKRDLEKLKTDITRQKYIQMIDDKLEERKTNENKKTWETLKETILTSAEETIRRKETKARREWFDDECEDKIKQKNEAWLK
ncbi:unnamed protein product [Acanthoscelides obtectus]|uniref:Uncharacterized protein n=1 Tax=Acanthoscelides obtectus TaxID=200917 RepID=A0A9P0PD10_ACAOB|nr:unnamed protein product [Acanthoscelides obtectus]CAK1682114.1 hypothetical protein AOBTE_LOCUS33434 [Acanthoscelides obtectus]